MTDYEYRETLLNHLHIIYGSPEKAGAALEKIEQRMKPYEETLCPDEKTSRSDEKTLCSDEKTSCSDEKTVCPDEKRGGSLTQEDVMLITYGDSITAPGQPGLETLRDFLEAYVGDAIRNVHLLPMYPYTSDDGFSVTDYRKINPALGDWPQVKALAGQYGLMFDAVINHISKSSEWFCRYLACEEPYRDYFITCDPGADYHTVTRPRALPLLTEFETAEGNKFVWTTFSSDQIDLNFACPELLAEILDLLVFYARSGARFIRLDAIGFLWKEPGTTCMHLPQTHEAVKLMKTVLNHYAPGTRIITETNVPQKENLSYFGNGYDEADLVYQFPLPPLTMYAMLTGDATALTGWLETLKLPNDKVTFFNFLSSHDGIGIRPAEGLLSAQQQEFLVRMALRNGGRVSYKDNGDGTRSPYELNINYQDALAGPDDSDEVRIGRFLAAETLLISLQGMPGIYIHSLLGSRNDYAGMTVSDIPRRINREQLDWDYLKGQLDGETNRSRIFHELIRRLRLRRKYSAFAPGASQTVLHLDNRVVAFRRGDENPVFVLVNVSSEPVSVTVAGMRGRDVLAQDRRAVQESLTLAPYEAAWVAAED